jgi:DNA-binding Lrp family transcriptional regulator
MGRRSSRASPQKIRNRDSGAEHVAVDTIDLAILAALQADGRMTNHALAEKVALSPSATLARTRRLERRGVIAGYGARVAPEKLGPSVTVFAEITLKRHHPEDFNHFDAVLAGEADVVEAAQVSGAFDYLIKAACRDVHAWGALVDRLTGQGADKIASHILMKDAKPFRGYPLSR